MAKNSFYVFVAGCGCGGGSIIRRSSCSNTVANVEHRSLLAGAVVVEANGIYDDLPPDDSITIEVPCDALAVNEDEWFPNPNSTGTAAGFTISPGDEPDSLDGTITLDSFIVESPLEWSEFRDGDWIVSNRETEVHGVEKPPSLNDATTHRMSNDRTTVGEDEWFPSGKTSNTYAGMVGNDAIEPCSTSRSEAHSMTTT